jgi:chromosome segregation ATPase
MRGTIVIFSLLAAVVAAAAADADVETQLREGLRSTMLQLRDAQTKTAEMEAAMVQSQLEAEKLKKDIAALQAQLVEERNVTANLRTELDEAKANASLQAAKLAKWETDYRALIGQVRKLQQALGESQARNTKLERLVAEQQVKTVELRAIGDEILDRYARHSLGTTILAREPFIGVNRAKLQTAIQDLETRLRAAGFGATNAPSPAPSPSNNNQR